MVPDPTTRSLSEGRNDPVVQEVIRRVVALARPERIILFGSRGRGDARPNSDVDLLVVKSGVHRRRLAQDLYRRLLGVGCAVDLIVVTPEDLERYGSSAALILGRALSEGTVVHEG